MASHQSLTHSYCPLSQDGGIKRVRIIGRRAAPLANYTEALPALDLPGSQDKALPSEPASALQTISNAASSALNAVTSQSTSSSVQARSVKATPLTAESFSPYGQVIAGPSSGSAEWPHAIVNQGTARKYPHQAQIKSSFPAEAEATTNMHLYRCDSTPHAALPYPIKMLERHRFSSQSFVPLASPPHSGNYLVVVALNSPQTDKPDLDTLAAFTATAHQGICYHPGVWHLPMTPIGPGGDPPLDYACTVAESARQPELNCDEQWWDEAQALISL